MAGGTGSRLWPLSRENRPKQFISVENGKSMLIQTIERICEIVPPEKCFIITNKNLLNATQETVRDIIPFSNIILEPSRKNTAACIAYATLLIKENFGSGLACFVPADGYVKNQTAYQDAIACAFRAAEDMNDLIVIGIKPSYPATGYGYIHIHAKSNETVFKVQKFIEKPDLDTAKQLIASQEFLWNSGILVGNLDTIIESVKQYLPNHYEEIAHAVMREEQQSCSDFIEKAYSHIENVSFDKGVLEKSDRIHAVKGIFDWDDIGSLDALAKTFDSDTHGNYFKGDHFGIDTSNTVIFSEGLPIATIGVENMLIAAMKDTILICPRDRGQEIRNLVEQLESYGYENLK